VVAPIDAVVIVTGGSSGPGREIARAAADQGCAVVVVYLDQQSEAESVIDDIVGSNGTAVAVRADLTDEMDIERMFQETVVMFGGSDLVVHAEPCDSNMFDRLAAQQLRRGGAIVSFGRRTPLAPAIAEELRERGIGMEALPGIKSADARSDIRRQVADLDRWLVERWLVGR
jgi:NADPH:quinone reductase-like Zn-dependent oxidoreductase